MMSVGLARKAAAAGASAAVLAALAAGLVASPAQAATATKSTSKGKVSVYTPKASDRDFEGACPVKVNFSSKIKVAVKGKTELAYRWLHGDGSKGKVNVIRLKGNGTKTVTVKQTLTFDEDVKGWEAVQVLGPKKATSKKGYFSVSCVKPQEVERTHLDKRISARAWASPSSYVGSCATPGDKVDFVGLIKTNRPSWVRYRWVLNGEAVDYGKVKVHDARKVSFGISPRSSQRGWAQLQVLGSDGASSNRAYYKVWCKDGGWDRPETNTRVSASASVSTAGSCRVSGIGSIRSTGAGKVRWSWLLNGRTVSSGEVLFGRGGGLRNVDSLSEDLDRADAKGGRVMLSISGPNNSDSVTQSYAPCKKPEVPEPGTSTGPVLPPKHIG
ncbi:hypothetical protein ACFOY2_13820 [Nonomuraea purpurea]|uniref:Ig-like domain-containing protein n=1 Tax=Nonomuraea purpurea TaxID=1849276 RepID=A0ABV8G659_9ACTN